MAKHTTFGIGGPARVFLVPSNEAELVQALKEHPGAFILGGGSNLLVADSGLDTVVSTSGLKTISCEKLPHGAVSVTVGAGYGFTRFSRWALQNGLSGAEFANGIPGSVGGAVVMNAGAYGGDVRGILQSARILVKGRFKDVSAKKLGLSYRASALPEGAVLVRARFKLKHGVKTEIEAKMKDALSSRKRTQPLKYPSAGSVFKNPNGDFAGRIVESLGLKGRRSGKAQISPIHANFIVNLGGASASDVMELIRTIEEKALSAGTPLEREIKLAGNLK